MAATDKSRVRFIYVKGSKLPALVDNNGIYYIENTKQVYVGNVLVADVTDYESIGSTYVASADIVDDILELKNANGRTIASLVLPTNNNVISDTTENWNAKSTLISKKDYIYVYTDHKIIDDKPIPGIKIGDGNAYIVDLPFVNEEFADHIMDSIAHVTQQDRDRWDDKVTCFIDLNDFENLVFSKD